MCMAANTVVTVRCDDVCSDACDNVSGEFPGLCSEAVLQGISSDTSSEGGISLSVCSVCSETSELRSGSSASPMESICPSKRMLPRTKHAIDAISIRSGQGFFFPLSMFIG